MSDPKEELRTNFYKSFEAGRQSVLQGGVVVPRETLETLVKYAERGAWAAEESRAKYRAIDAATDLLAGSTPENGETT